MSPAVPYLVFLILFAVVLGILVINGRRDTKH